MRKYYQTTQLIVNKIKPPHMKFYMQINKKKQKDFKKPLEVTFKKCLFELYLKATFDSLKRTKKID